MVRIFVILVSWYLVISSGASAQTRPSYYDPTTIPQQTAFPTYEQQSQRLATNSTGCLLFTQTLYWGVTDADTHGEVSRLQEFLGLGKTVQKGVYDEATELAVRAYQRRFDILTPGLSCKTGYGIVEKKTRDIINAKNDCTPLVPRKTVSCSGVPQCPLIRTNITRGTVDAEGVRGVVSTLQCFLRNAGVYTGPVNGVFGLATQTAVTNYQTTRTLGVTGVVNAQTREAIAQCAPARAAEQGRRAKSAHYTLRIDPARGPGPLTVTMSFAFNGTTCSSYELGWGDGTLADSFDAGRPNTCTQKPFTQTYTHTYTTPGIYDISVRQGEDALSRLPVSNSAQVIVE